MTIRELKKLINEYHNLENDELLADIRKQAILENLKHENDLFITTAEDFQYNLRELFSQKLGLPLNCIHLKTRIKHLHQDNSSNYVYHIKQTIELKTKKATLNQNLPTFAMISKTELTDRQLNENKYSMSLLPILLTNGLINCNLIHNSCWIIVEKYLINSQKKEESIN